MSIRRRTFSASAALLGVLVLIGAPGASADRSYGDPAGDSGAAPDITSVSIAHVDAYVTITVATNQPILAAGASFWGYLDTDGNSATGLPSRGLGADHFFLADADGGVLAHVVNNMLVFDFGSTITTGYTNGSLTIRLSRSGLDSPEELLVGFEAEQEDAAGTTIATDYAPDGPPYYHYSFAPLTLSLGKPVGVPAAPRAGKPFVVTAPVIRSDEEPFATGDVRCTARIGKQTVRATGSVKGSAARCSMRIPRNTTGKPLRGSLTVQVEEGATVTKAFAFRIR